MPVEDLQIYKEDIGDDLHYLQLQVLATPLSLADIFSLYHILSIFSL